MRTPSEANQYSTTPSFLTISTCSPVSSLTSRIAACSSDSPSSGVPLGSPQTPSESRPQITTSHPPSPSPRTPPPPAEPAPSTFIRRFLPALVAILVPPLQLVLDRQRVLAEVGLRHRGGGRLLHAGRGVPQQRPQQELRLAAADLPQRPDRRLLPLEVRVLQQRRQVRYRPPVRQRAQRSRRLVPHLRVLARPLPAEHRQPARVEASAHRVKRAHL